MTDSERERLDRLYFAVFGLPENPASGLIWAVAELNRKIGTLTSAVVVAALTFGAGSISICATILLSG